MPKSASERIASYRERRKAEGMATISLVIPAADAALFAQFAAVRRDEYRKTKRPVLSPQQQWLAMLATLAPEVAQSEFSRPGGTTGGAPVSRAESVADTLIEQIIGLGWPVGMPLGSEPELMKTLGVSRTVLRQAVRLLEHQERSVRRGGDDGRSRFLMPDRKTEEFGVEPGQGARVRRLDRRSPPHTATSRSHAGQFARHACVLPA